MNQTGQGKAFEYACLQALVSLVSPVRQIAIIENSSLQVASAAWGALEQVSQDTMQMSAVAGVKALLELEPKIMQDGSDVIEVALQADREGREGDVRDVLIVRRALSWEIGISVKHNHEAVKHSRLSPSIDFGKEWLGIECTNDYFAEIRPIFDRLEILKRTGTKWGEVSDKSSDVYAPLLEAFMRETRRLDEANPGTVPARLLTYLLGRKDFYKLISNNAGRFTVLQCFNLHGTLNTASTERGPAVRARRIELPSKIYHLDFAERSGVKSQTTVQLVMDNNWAISFRIHSASTFVERSLKFDIQMTGAPSNLFSNTVSW